MTALAGIGDGFTLILPGGLSYFRMIRDGMPGGGITTATRSWDQQWDWYIHQGQPGYPDLVANPKTSKHVYRPGWADEGARALDLKWEQAEWVRLHGSKYGWMSGRVKGEWWHKEYEPWNDQFRDAPAPVTPTPTPEPVEEDDMFEEADRDRAERIELKLNRDMHEFTVFEMPDGRLAINFVKTPFWMAEPYPDSGYVSKFVQDALKFQGRSVVWLNDADRKWYGSVLTWRQCLENSGLPVDPVHPNRVSSPVEAFGSEVPWCGLS